MRRLHRCLLVAFLGGLAVGSLASCSHPDDQGSTLSAWSQGLLDKATDPEGNLPEEVASILIEAANSGEMPFDLYKRGIDLHIECLEDVGFTTSYSLSPEGEDGLVQILLSYSFPPGLEIGDPEVDALDALALECETQYEMPIAIAYVTQPTAVATREARFEEYRPLLHECLVDLGSELPLDAPHGEYSTEIALYRERGHDCAESTGYQMP